MKSIYQIFTISNVKRFYYAHHVEVYLLPRYKITTCNITHKKNRQQLSSVNYNFS